MAYYRAILRWTVECCPLLSRGGGGEIFGVVFSKKYLFWPILNAAMPEESMSNGKKETMTTFKIWRFVNDFRIETENGKVPSA